MIVADRSVLVSELRLRDREDLIAYVALIAGPLEDTIDPSADDYAKQLEELYDNPTSWPPPLHSPEADAILYGDTDGLAFVLAIALRDTPGLTVSLARDIAETITSDELQSVERVLWGHHEDGKAKILRMIDAHLGFAPFVPYEVTPGEPITMDQAIGEIITGGQIPGLGWATPAIVGDLTISQFRLVRSGGAPSDEGDSVPADPELRAKVEAARRKFFGIPDYKPPVGETETPPIPEDGGEWENAL
jgi:hypothetical protein